MTTQTNSLESFSEFHSFADIEEVKRLANDEQARRFQDVDGEQLKKNNAFLISAMVEASVRPTWFKQGSAYVFDVLKVAKNTKDGLAFTASQARTRVVALGLHGIETVNDLKHKMEVAGSKTIETAQDVKAKSFDAAQNAKLKLEHSADDLSKKSLDTVHDVQSIVQQKLNAANDVKENITSSARQGAKKMQGLVRSFSQNLIEKANSTWAQMTASSIIAFVILEEERERLYRIADDGEGFAIINAFNTAALIKQLGPEFYRPASEPSSWYFTHLLEEGERVRRLKQDSLDNLAVKNAAAVSKIVPRHIISRPLPMAKQEVVEEIKVSRPLLATM